MKTKQFIETLRLSPEHDLIFINSEGISVHTGYHLTEIKAVTYDTVDCGGQRNDWNETILQLWVPEDADDEYMKAGKFVRIFDSVRSSIPLREDANVRVEYGDENFFPSVYDVRSVETERNTLRVLVEPPETTCKARDRRASSKAEASCC